jgi:hypothetical protein
MFPARFSNNVYSSFTAAAQIRPQIFIRINTLKEKGKKCADKSKALLFYQILCIFAHFRRSFGCFLKDKQTNKQTNKQTSKQTNKPI